MNELLDLALTAAWHVGIALLVMLVSMMAYT